MTDEERDIITQFIQRVSGANRIGGGSVPGTVQALPPVDAAADRLIGDLFQRYPEARYRLTQTAFVQEHALTEAQGRIQQLQTQLQQAQSQAQSQAQGQSTAQPAAGGGFFHNLFGGGGGGQQPPQQPYQPYPSPPQYAPQAQYTPQYAQAAPAGMFQRSGSGFLGSALTTAAGVAGGMVAGNALMNLFEGHHGGGFGQPGFGESGFGQPGFGGGGNAGPWGGEPAAPDAQVTGSAWDNQVETGQPAGWGDQGGNDTAGSDSSGGAWDNGGGDAGSSDMGGGGGDASWDNNA